MISHAPLKIERKREVLARLGISKSTFHNRINKGLLPPPINLGDRAVGWFEHETTAVLIALAADKTEQQVKQLVAELMIQRSGRGRS